MQTAVSDYIGLIIFDSGNNNVSGYFMNNPFKIIKSYKTSLTLEEINALILRKVEAKSLLGTRKYFCRFYKDGFRITSFVSGGFTTIKATMQRINATTELSVIYKPTYNPFFFLIPACLLLLWALFSDNFMLNGKPTLFVERFMFLLLVFGILILVSVWSSYNPMNNERIKLEKELLLES